MPADTLVWKKKGRKFSAKIVSGHGHNRTPESCHINVNLQNYKDLALFLYDLKFLWDAKLDTAIKEYKKMTSESAWPF